MNNITYNPDQPRLEIRLAQRIAAKKTQLDLHRPLSPTTVRRLGESLRLLLTYHSNAIEGNTLTLRETQVVIETGITIGGHPLREHLEATNHAHAYEYLAELAAHNEPITRATILGLHHLVMESIDETAGNFRTGAVYIRGARTTPPPAGQIERLMSHWLEWIHGPSLDLPPLARAAIAHFDFETIHPFFDGNGRTGRLLLNLMLMQDGYPPALLLRSWRINYLRALDSAGLGRFNPLANLVGRAVEGCLDLYLEACTDTTATLEDPYKSLAQLAESSGYSADYLGWLFRQGRLEAIKRGGRLYSTHEAITHYKQDVEQGAIPKGRPRKHG